MTLPADNIILRFPVAASKLERLSLVGLFSLALHLQVRQELTQRTPLEGEDPNLVEIYSTRLKMVARNKRSSLFELS